MGSRDQIMRLHYGNYIVEVTIHLSSHDLLATVSVWLSHARTQCHVLLYCNYCGNYIVEVTVRLLSHDLLAAVSCVAHVMVMIMISRCIPWPYELQLRWPSMMLCIGTFHSGGGTEMQYYGGDPQPAWLKQLFPFACMYCKMGRVIIIIIVLTRSSGSPPPLWNAPLQSIMDGHLSYSSYSHGMHLLIMCHCNTHSCEQVMGWQRHCNFNNVVSTVIVTINQWWYMHDGLPLTYS